MKDLGEKLRRSRQEKNITLEEINQKTKIHRRYLEALEKGDSTPFAGEVYFKGALCSYAQIVGLDPDRVLEQYYQAKRAELPAEGPTEGPLRLKRPVPAREPEEKLGAGRQEQGEEKKPGLWSGWKAWSGRSARSEGQERPLRSSPPQYFPPYLLVLLLVLALSAAGIWVAKNRSLADSPGPGDPLQTETPPIEETGGDPSAEMPVAPIPVLTPDPQQSTLAESAYRVSGTEKLEVILSFTGNCWINLFSDDRELYQQTFSRGEVISVEGQEKIWIRLGNPPGAEITVNGLTLEGQEQTAAHNYLFLLQP